MAHLGNAGLHVQTGPSVHSTQRSEHGGFCGPENSNKQRQKHRQTSKHRQPRPRARAPCPSRGANAVRSMQTGARRIVQGSEVLISHLHKSKRVSKLGTRGAKQHAMRRKRGTVLLFRDEIDRSDSVFGNATPRAVRKVPARRSRAPPMHTWRRFRVGVGREKKAANLFAEKICGPACPKPKFFVVARLLSLKKCEPDPTGQDS